MPDSFKLKTIRTTITLGKGTFGGGGNSKIIEGLATDVDITKPGLPEKTALRYPSPISLWPTWSR